MKRLRSVAGILLIGAALLSMYLWNQDSRRRAAEAAQGAAESLISAEAELPALSPKEAMLLEGSSSFLIRDNWIFFKSRLIENGDTVALYFRPSGERLGAYKVDYIKDNELEIVCGLEEYIRLTELVYGDLKELSGSEFPLEYESRWTRPLLLVLEAEHE